ncbi:MAG: hypothetical protein ACRDSJ_05760 [Rubrobacteraceae bacterium]
MERGGVFWVGVMLALVALAYLAPYTILSGVDHVFGSFLFWVVFGLVAICVNAAIAMRWRD